MTMLNRRSWMQTAAGGIAALSAASYVKAAGANERVRVGVIGLGSMGRQHVIAWKSLPNVELVYICDLDPKQIARVLKESKDDSLKSVQSVNDMRRVLDDQSIDIISIATPDHWHVPAALLALEAGKHVYVEKPCAHNMREAHELVEASRRHKLCVQHGTQSRSTPFIQEAIQLLHEGIIGDVLVSKAWNVQHRPNIGHMQPSSPPQGVDYDTWLGPAPEMPFQANRFHSNWRWWYNFGTGDMGNDGVHDIDIARWGLGVDTLPSRVASIGAKYFHDDDQQFPDTQTAIFEYPGDGGVGQRRQLVFEMRLWTVVSPFNVDNGCEFYGTKGTMMLSKNGKLQVIDENKQRMPADQLPQAIKAIKPSIAYNMSNLIDGMREGKPLNADIEIGYQSASLCHLGNISARLGRSLEFDPTNLQIVGDEDANKLLGREYRSHWGTPRSLVS